MTFVVQSYRMKMVVIPSRERADGKITCEVKACAVLLLAPNISENVIIFLFSQWRVEVSNCLNLFQIFY